MRNAVLLVLFLLAGCGPGGLICRFVPGESGYARCNDYSVGWTQTGSTPPRCVDAVTAAAEDLNPAPDLNPLHGVIVWHPEPFYCGFQRVWGCSELGRDYVEVQVAATVDQHAATTALPEEIAHWVWANAHPETFPVEEWRKDPLTGLLYYWRDPAFTAYYQSIITKAHQDCP